MAFRRSRGRYRRGRVRRGRSYGRRRRRGNRPMRIGYRM